MICHRCGAHMYQAAYQPAIPADRWWCRCGAWRDAGESLEDVSAREAQTADVMAMLDAAIGELAAARGTTDQRDPDRQATAEMEAMMGQTIQTRGCSKCGGTMYRCVGTDDQGNPTNVPLFICNNCGNMEG
ncbi:hypothetical protein [Streptomyces sp. NPDC101206]|uniref:hypothetical protein n=1 Tax=Streptomyces sp. NPDC101206 TaxID=3366128 RepID=UPI00380ED63E